MLRVALVPLLLVAATGCSAVVGSDDGTNAQSTSVTGVVVVDRTVSSEGATTRGEASARFVRVRGAIDDGTLRLVGAGLDVPPAGECAAVGDQGASRPVELLDVGAVAIESLGSGDRVTLAPRQVPDVVDLVSGTMYSARIDEAAVPAGSDIAVVVGGSADVPAFSVRARAPEAPDDLRLMGLDDATANLTWTAMNDDAIYVDIEAPSAAGATPTHVRCTFADDGHGAVPSSFFGDNGVVTVHRLHRDKLSIPGVDDGEVRFDFARALAYHR